MSSLQQLGMIRAVLRGRLNDPDGTKFMDPELNANINLIQQDVVMRLLAINKKWLAKTRIITGTFAPGAYATVPLPDDVLEILDYMTAGGVPITIIPPERYSLIVDNDLYEPSNAWPVAVHIGTDLRVYPYNAANNSVMTHVIKPTDLVDDSDETIIPVEHVEKIVAGCEVTFATRAGFSEQEKKARYDAMFMEREVLKKKIEVRDDVPGEVHGAAQ